MNKFDSETSKPTLDADEGWAVQIYGRNRHLFCVLYPSHAWSFLLGCLVGLLLSMTWIGVTRQSPPSEVETPMQTSPAESPLLQVD